MKHKQLIVAGALTVIMTLLLGAVPAFAAGMWQGITWNDVYGSSTVDADGNLVVTAGVCETTRCLGAAHHNTPNDVRTATSPWIEFSFIDEGPDTPGAQIWVEDETLSGSDLGAWIQFGAFYEHSTYQIYLWDYDQDLADNGSVDDSAGYWLIDTNIPRRAGERTLTLGQRADGMIDFVVDGELVHSTTNITPNYFGDVYLAARTYSPGESVVFTAYTTGDGWVPPAPTLPWDPGDGRINPHAAAPVAIYLDPVRIYSVNPETSNGTLTLTLSDEEIAAAGVPGEANKLLAEATNPFTGQPIALYRLTTGEFQLNTAYADGKPYSVKWAPDETRVTILAW